MHVKLALADHVRLHEPLPWDIMNEQGVMLLSQGMIPTDQQQLDTLIEKGAYVEQEAFERHKKEMELEQQAYDPFRQWNDIHQRYQDLLLRKEPQPGFVGELTQLSSAIRALVDKDTDAAIFAMTRIKHSHYAISHALQVGVCCDIYGRFAEWAVNDTVTLIHAALTMNIAMLDLQRILAVQAVPLTAAQRAEINSHPARARQQLEALDVTDPVWLQTVAEHHETRDGKGYPAGLKEVSPMAEVLNIVDRYRATMTRRYSRDPLASNEAARELYTMTTGPLQTIVARLVKVFGLFPPGTPVRLANGETAVVVHRSELANRSRVATLVSANGVKLSEPVERDTADSACSIAHALSDKHFAVPLDPARLYGYVT